MKIEGFVAGSALTILNEFNYNESVADDGTVGIPVTDSGGFGIAQAGDGEQYGFFSFTSGGSVTLISNSTNCVNTNTDAKFCIYDGGSNVIVKNRLGSSKNVLIKVWYA